MTKPWEEEWATSIWMHDGQQDPLWALHTNTDPPMAGRIKVPFCEFDPNMGAKARLASAAPDMARVLLALEGKGSCNVCGRRLPAPRTPADELENMRKARDEAADLGLPEDLDMFRWGHRPDCALDAALRKAGVPR